MASLGRRMRRQRATRTWLGHPLWLLSLAQLVVLVGLLIEAWFLVGALTVVGGR